MQHKSQRTCIVFVDLGGGDGLGAVLYWPGGLGAKFGLPCPPTGGLLGREGGGAALRWLGEGLEVAVSAVSDVL